MNTTFNFDLYYDSDVEGNRDKIQCEPGSLILDSTTKILYVSDKDKKIIGINENYVTEGMNSIKTTLENIIEALNGQSTE